MLGRAGQSYFSSERIGAVPDGADRSSNARSSPVPCSFTHELPGNSDAWLECVTQATRSVPILNRAARSWLERGAESSACNRPDRVGALRKCRCGQIEANHTTSRFGRV